MIEIFKYIPALLALGAFGVCFYIIRAQMELIKDLNNRLMARDYREYQTVQKPEPKKILVDEKPKRPVDPVLGGVY